MFYVQTKKNMNRLQVIQNRFLRFIFGASKLTSLELLHRIANLERVEERIWFYRLKLMNKIALSPTYHPLYQVRAQLFNQMHRPTVRYTYSQKGPVNTILLKISEECNRYYGTATDFVTNLDYNVSIRART